MNSRLWFGAIFTMQAAGQLNGEQGAEFLPHQTTSLAEAAVPKADYSPYLTVFA
ncbi:MAG: hypothetical protein IT279_09965, partial [Ignavibacteriaceae bacterium]|nr:hypothetical protein [Ignavibacteriaceae bacterium]